MNLPTELEELIQSKVESGRYSSVSHVVRDALQLLEQRDKAFLPASDAVRQKIEEGWQSARRGELVDGDEFFDEMDAHLEALETSGRK